VRHAHVNIAAEHLEDAEFSASPHLINDSLGSELGIHRSNTRCGDFLPYIMA